MTKIPDTVTQTIRADELTVGQVLFTPMYGPAAMETVTRISRHSGYVSVTTDRTDSYMWPGSDTVRVLAGGAA